MIAPALTALAVWLTGHALIGACRASRPRGALELEATAVLLGLALAPAAFAGAVILLGPMPPAAGAALMAALAIPGAVFLRGNQRRARGGGPREPWTRGQLALLAAVLFFAAFAVFAAASAPVHGFDSTYHYAYKGKLLFHEGFATDAWTDLEGAVGRPITHPGYPLGIPALQALVASVRGSFDEDAARPLGALFALTSTALLFAALRPRGRGPALLAALVWIGLPLLYYWRVPHENPLLAAYGLVFGPESGADRFGHPGAWSEAVAWCLDGTADLPLAAFVLGGFLLLSRAVSGDGDALDAVGAGVLLGGAVLSKNEGAPLSLAVALALVFAPGARALRSRAVSAAPALAVALALASPWLAARGALPVVDEDYAARLAPSNVLAHLDRAPEVAALFARSLGDVLLWNLLWPLLFGAVVWSLRRPRDLARDPALPALAVVALAFLLAFAVLLVTPWNLEALHRTGIPTRLFLHVTPLAILATFSLMWRSKEGVS